MIKDTSGVFRKSKSIKAAFGLIKAKQTASLEDMEDGIRKGASVGFSYSLIKDSGKISHSKNVH